MSSESLNCQVDWRPSRLLCAALASLGALAATSLWLSALPWPARAPLALLALCHGLRLARREARRRSFSLYWAPDGDAAVMTFPDRSRRLLAPAVRFRGHLACVSGTGEDGRARHLVWWPDTLPAVSRRALRLAGRRRIGESGLTLATMPG